MGLPEARSHGWALPALRPVEAPTPSQFPQFPRASGWPSYGSFSPSLRFSPREVSRTTQPPSAWSPSSHHQPLSTLLGAVSSVHPPISVGSSPFWEQKLRTVPFALSRVASMPLSHTIRKATPPRGWRRLGEGKNHLLLAESSRKVSSSSHQEKVQQVRKWGGPRRQG